MTARFGKIERDTRETQIELRLNLDGQSETDISTGLGFFDHMLTSLAFHSCWDLYLRCQGDLNVDDHHTIEDCGIALGEAFAMAVGDKKGIQRFGSRYAPLDEALARSVIDLSGRSGGFIDLQLRREKLGDVACENLTHFFQSFASSGFFTLHVDVIRGVNDHHKAEAAFKSTALAIRDAVTITSAKLPSTKGVL